MKRSRFRKHGQSAALTFAGALLVSLAGVGSAHAEGDAGRGADVFAQECSGCHSVKENRNKMGPSLFAVVGRHCGSIPDFAYSDALKQADLTWTPSQLDAYITKPQQAVPGVRMPYGGLSDDKARADLIAYLTSVRK